MFFSDFYTFTRSDAGSYVLTVLFQYLAIWHWTFFVQVCVIYFFFPLGVLYEAKLKSNFLLQAEWFIYSKP